MIYYILNIQLDFAMTKTEAIKLFKGKGQADLGRALGRTRQAIQKWPEILTENQECIVLGRLEQIKIQKSIMERGNE